MRVQTLRFVSSAVPEILEGPEICKVGHVTRATSLLTIFIFFGFASPTRSIRMQNERCISSAVPEILLEVGLSYLRIRRVIDNRVRSLLCSLTRVYRSASQPSLCEVISTLLGRRAVLYIGSVRAILCVFVSTA